MSTKKRIQQFDRANCFRFSNILHAQYQRKQYELVKAADATKTNVSAEWLAEWEKAIKVETEINMQASASVFTAKMREKDAERDLLLTNIFSVVRAQRTSPVAAIREAAQRLYVVFKPYFGIQDEIFEAESGHIIGMEQDAARYQTEITALGLKPVFDELHAVNQAYELLRTGRRAEELDAKLPDSRTARRETDELFEGACQCILASYILAKTAADKQLIADLIAAMNKTSVDFKGSHNASAAHKKGDKPGKDRPNNKKEKLQKEFDEKVAPLIAAFEQQEGLAAGSLKFAGKATGRGAERKYELAVSGTEKTIWVQVKGDHLVQVVSVKPKE